MVIESGNRNSDISHRCGPLCLGPLTFHSQAVGDMVCLSLGGRLAERPVTTFKNGVVFSSRQVKTHERIRLRVEKGILIWHGALRVGFTNVPPSARSLPLPCMAIPNLTDTPGHWMAPVPESYCQTGSELEFWVSSGGKVFVKKDNCRQHKLLSGVNLGKPLWAMIDIYGQTCSVFLLGSERKGLFYNHRSCPAPECVRSPEADTVNNCISKVLGVSGNSDTFILSNDREIPADKHCVVCMDHAARITLPCGHRCLCFYCAPQIFSQLGTCPLCRHVIRAPAEDVYVAAASQSISRSQ